MLIFGMYIVPCIYYISISYPDHHSIIYKVLYFNLQRAPIQEANNEHTYQCNPVLLVQAYKSGTTLQTMLILDQTLPCYPAVWIISIGFRSGREGEQISDWSNWQWAQIWAHIFDWLKHKKWFKMKWHIQHLSINDVTVCEVPFKYQKIKGRPS